MCGIAGFVGLGNSEILKKMTSSLRHRGPDHEGTFELENVFFGHTRLSVIDLSDAGRQPIHDRKENVLIVFNGEIYNFKNIKEEIQNKDSRPFISNSDTEVILRAYSAYGNECFGKLNGMFAIAIYDFKTETLILARDRFGKKPLYYCSINGTLIFGSELKALLKHPEVKKEISDISLNEYLFYGYVSTPKTIFKNIFKLEPGTVLSVSKNQVVQKSFWEPNFNQSEMPLSEAIEQLAVLADDSVKSRMLSDVPLGVFLSGGLDSSTVAYFAQKNSNKKIQTFSISFEEESFDESRYARKVANYLHTEHFEQRVTARDMLDTVEIIPQIFDEPVADPSVIPTYLLSAFTRKNVTVALSGDGGDEVFAGYPTFQAEQFAKIYKHVPGNIRSAISFLSKTLPVGDTNMNLAFKVQKFLEGTDKEPIVRHQEWLSYFNLKKLSSLRNGSISNEDQFGIIDSTLRYSTHLMNQTSEGNILLYTYLKTYLLDQVLVKVDRASMANGLEVRSPFLDYRLVNYMYSLPYQYKCYRLTTKYILKKLMKNKLPEDIINRTKKGFGIPLAMWLKTELRELCQNLLSADELQRHGFFNHRYVEFLLRDHLNGVSDNSRQIWSLIVFQLWYNTWIRETDA